MTLQPRPEITWLFLAQPLALALVWIGLLSLLKEPARRNLSALLIAGGGAAYLGGGLGVFEALACVGFTGLAYLGLKDYRFIALGWIAHTGWDVVHHLYGQPILPFQPLSSFGCAITDPILAVWYFAGAPSVLPAGRRAHT